MREGGTLGPPLGSLTHGGERSSTRDKQTRAHTHPCPETLHTRTWRTWTGQPWHLPAPSLKGPRWAACFTTNRLRRKGTLVVDSPAAWHLGSRGGRAPREVAALGSGRLLWVYTETCFFDFHNLRRERPRSTRAPIGPKDVLARGRTEPGGMPRVAHASELNTCVHRLPNDSAPPIGWNFRGIEATLEAGADNKQPSIAKLN